MLPAKRDTLIRWLVPSLLAIITTLLTLGGMNAMSIMQRQADDIAGLRRDFQYTQIQMEGRVTRLEDAVIRHAYLEEHHEQQQYEEERPATPPALPRFKYNPLYEPERDHKH